jgi:hypothetical protein
MKEVPPKCLEALQKMAKAVNGLPNNEVIDAALNIAAICICKRHPVNTVEEAEAIYRATCQALRLMLVTKGFLPSVSDAKH